MRSAFVAVMTVAATAPILIAQRPAFEVAAVKPNNAGRMGITRFNLQGGERFTAENFLLRNLITEAYVAEHAELIDPPGWLDYARYDINAKAEKPVSRDTMRLMLQSLLAERFKLAVHTEDRVGKIFALMLARADGKLGSNLRHAQKTCEELRAESQATTGEPCGLRSFASAQVRGSMKVRGFGLATLIGLLQAESGRRVVDKTGLTGAFDWELTFTPRAFMQQTFDRDRFPTIDPDGPSIFTALQEQWGLKLQPQTEPIKFLVIDHIERPTPN